MELQLQPGKYVVAVSGGVDSIVLLDLLVTQFSHQSGYDFVIAHYNHGIRKDAGEDEALVGAAAQKYNLPFYAEQGRLGEGASEAVARDKRYEFLRSVAGKCNAQAIITAHHQDDLLETIILNLLRGTSRKGLSSLRTTSTLVRPLLSIPKAQLVQYALAHKLSWRDDTTNQDDSYRRNYVRHHILPKFDAPARANLLALHKHICAINDEIDSVIADWLNTVDATTHALPRRGFIMLPHAVAKEVLAEWLRKQGLRQFDRFMLDRAVVQLKTLAPGKQIDIYAGERIIINESMLAKTP